MNVGNGRIGRAITDYILSKAEDSPYRYYSLSDQIQQYRKGYYRELENAQRGACDVTDWLLWFLDILTKALRHSSNVAAKVLHRTAFWQTYATTPLNERQVQMLRKLRDDFFGKLTTDKWAKMMRCSKDTALRDIKDLVQKGILMQLEGGGRNTAYRLTITPPISPDH